MKHLLGLLVLTILLQPAFPQEIRKIRVMTYNIHHGEGMDGKIDISRIADLIMENNIDLAAFQEVDKGIERSNNLDIMKELSEKTGMHFSFGKNIDYRGGDYGNGILSKYQIKHEANLHYKMIREGEQRGLLQTVIEIDSIKIVFMNTHIDYRQDDSERLLNVEEISFILKDYEEMPAIVCGDFNDIPGSRMHTNMKANFIDVWEILNPDSGYSYPADKPVKRIDFIFLSKEGTKELKPVSIKVLQTEASDHLPVIAEFEVVNQ